MYLTSLALSNKRVKLVPNFLCIFDLYLFFFAIPSKFCSLVGYALVIRWCAQLFKVACCCPGLLGVSVYLSKGSYLSSLTVQLLEAGSAGHKAGMMGKGEWRWVDGRLRRTSCE